MTDPVCSIQVAPATAAQHRHTSTGTESFCSAGCAAAFDSGPHRTAPTRQSRRPGAGNL